LSTGILHPRHTLAASILAGGYCALYEAVDGISRTAIAARAARSMAMTRGRLYLCEAIFERLAQGL
jgi:hypothetical protein